MLFTTTTFALLFLPITLMGFFALGRWKPDAAALWLFVASVFFYGWWMPQFTLLLLASIGVNFWIGGRIRSTASSRAWLVLGIAFNLGLLAYFKYANFVVDNLNAAFGTGWDIGKVILPIGISFYSFTQIAFLVDTHQGKVNEARFVHYGLFVTYFPHLIAGPVLHHAQMMPQFRESAVYRVQGGNMIGGLAIFALGLFKKIVLADGVAPYADAVFKPTDGGAMPSMEEAWLGAVAYTLQLYFDFSGYSDMAIGLSWMFNVRLPFNFDSPYRAANISDFWRRWHISLSTFLRDYLYVPLGGNRRGPARRYFNLAATMVLGGLWHGASWSFVIWGALHGSYLMLNHGFRALLERVLGGERARGLARSLPWITVSWALTFVAVIVAWVFFRAETLPGAWRMVQAMWLPREVPLEPVLVANAGLHHGVGWIWCAVLGGVAVAMPNSNQLGTALLQSLRQAPPWAPYLGGALLVASLLLLMLNTLRDSVSTFIYFNF